MKVNCNECNQEFEIRKNRRRLSGNIDEHYFECPHCHAEFISYYMDTEAREQYKKLQSLNTRMRNTKGIAARDKLDERIKEEKQKLAAMMDELKLKITHDRQQPDAHSS